MQVTSANSFNPQTTAAIAVDNQARVNQQNQPLTTNQEQKKTQQESQQNQKQTRFDVDQQALALIEQQRTGLSVDAKENTADKTLYDQPSQSNRTAVSAYQSVDNIVKRDAIQQAFGVDLYA